MFLREFSLLDAPHFYNLNQDHDVVKFSGDTSFISIHAAEVFLKNYDHYQKYTFGRWAVIRKSDSEFLGWCGLKFSPELDEVDIGFRFHKRFWNQGYATEAARECIDYGFRKFNIKLIVGRAMKENLSSIRVLEKSGLTFEKYFNFDGNEGVVYKILNSNIQNI